MYEGYDGIDQEDESDRAEDADLHVLYKLDYLQGYLFPLWSKGDKEVVEERFELIVDAEGLEDGEADSQEGDKGEEGGIGKSHGPKDELSLKELLNHHIEKSQDCQGGMPEPSVGGNLVTLLTPYKHVVKPMPDIYHGLFTTLSWITQKRVCTVLYHDILRHPPVHKTHAQPLHKLFTINADQV